MTIDNNMSCALKSIPRQRDMGRNLIEKLISNGDDTYLWFDPWISGKLLVDLDGTNFMLQLAATISQLNSTGQPI